MSETLLLRAEPLPSFQPKRPDASPVKVSRRRSDSVSPIAGPSPVSVRSLTFSLARMIQSCRHTITSRLVAARRNSRRMLRVFHRRSIKGPLTIPLSTFDYLTVLSMPQVSVEFL